MATHTDGPNTNMHTEILSRRRMRGGIVEQLYFDDLVFVLCLYLYTYILTY